MKDELTGLPKVGQRGVPVEMTAEQVSVYDAVVAARKGDTSWRVRCAGTGISAHSGISAEFRCTFARRGAAGSASNPRDARVILQRSG
jgi:hypothetical protein